jgi:hypothetical protein
MLNENYMHKCQEKENVKTFYEFGNDPMKMYFKHKGKNEGSPYN